MMWIDGALREIIEYLIGEELYQDSVLQWFLSAGYHVMIFLMGMAILLFMIMGVAEKIW